MSNKIKGGKREGLDSEMSLAFDIEFKDYVREEKEKN